jgi:hypothetical protein
VRAVTQRKSQQMFVSEKVAGKTESQNVPPRH